ncbi:fibrobacter succinogenes major paralogous domain-containing protein [uncultured Draconibacterium sp.]|uniref:fibrobacter succinogenes major paralogous domain-containing protein n=1 Tax=uncultured Draconibacterium sp. TaxID=1573823 RepID=UPI0029C645C6|nr:fibrobacter succinogenes major paralogous domain-containing protein [uncultured Draconibacterium sp.]
MKSKTLTFLLSIAMLLLCSCDDEPFDADSGTFVDSRDNHEYQWVKIGEQIWMAENLAYIPDDVCELDSQCGTWIYDYSGEGSYGVNYQIYGCLYDWETAQQVCPEGWHLPSDEEWMELERFLGMPEDQLDRGTIRGQEANVGGKLKEIGYSHWAQPNEGATDESGFSALPAGVKLENRFSSINQSSYYWTSNSHSEIYAYHRMLRTVGQDVERDIKNKTNGLSIRCIKD